MLAISHSIAGAVIADFAPTPVSGYLLALVSHPILDLIPHWDLRTRHTKRSKNKIVGLSLADALAGIGLGFFLFAGKVPPIELFATIMMAQLPDWLESPYQVFNWQFPPFTWIKQFQHLVHSKIPFPDGLYTQLILVFFLLLMSR